MLKASMVSEDKSIYGPSLPNASKKPNITIFSSTGNNKTVGRRCTFLPVCGPCLVKDRGVAEGIAEDEGVDSGRFVSVFSKLLGQKASQRSPKEMNLIGNKHKDPKNNEVSKNCFNYHQPQNIMLSPVIRLKYLQQLEV